MRDTPTTLGLPVLFLERKYGIMDNTLCDDDDDEIIFCYMRAGRDEDLKIKLKQNSN
jgi:hypothetical protein